MTGFLWWALFAAVALAAALAAAVADSADEITRLTQRCICEQCRDRTRA